MKPAKAAPPPTSTERLETLYHANFALPYGDPAALGGLIDRGLRDAGETGDGLSGGRLEQYLAQAAGDPAVQAAARDLATAAAACGIEDAVTAAHRQAVLDRHAELIARVNDRGDGNKVVVFVAKSPYFVVLREAIYLRRNGFRTYLLTLYPVAEDLRRLFEENMDGIACLESSHFALRELMRAMEPDVFHLQCWQLSYELGRMAVEMKTTAAVVCDFYDISSIYAPRDELCTVWDAAVVDLDYALEHYILHHASAVISRYPPHVMANWGRRHGHTPPNLTMQAYSLPEFVAPAESPKLSRQDGRIHLVYAGGLIPVWINPKLFPEVYMPATFAKLLDQGLAIDVLHDPHRPINDDPVYAPFRELARRYPHFRLIDGVTPDKLAGALSKYDYGILLTDFPPEVSINDDQKGGVVATKIFAYLEANIPVLVSAEYTEMARIAEEHGVGLAVHTRNLGRLAEILRAHDYHRTVRNIVRFNKDYSMERQIRKLIALYKEAAAHKAPPPEERGDEFGGPGFAAGAMRRALHGVLMALGAQRATLGHLDDALDCYRLAGRLQPASTDALLSTAALCETRGLTRDAIDAYREALRREPGRLDLHSRLLACQARLESGDGVTLLADARSFGRACAATPRPRAGWPLRRIGMVAARLDRRLRDTLLGPFLAGHDPAAARVHCYVGDSDDPAADEALRGMVAGWTGIGGMDDEALAAAVADDGIEVLVELTGHAGPNRLSAFARRLAPVQALWSTLPVPSGLDSMDVLIADRVLVPYGREGHFTETVLRVPGLAWAYRPSVEAPEPDGPPALLQGCVTFASLVTADRVTPALVALWAAILTRLPDSRLLLWHDSRLTPGLPAALTGSFAARGVGPGRVLFRDASAGQAPFDPTTCDLLLDGFPIGAGLGLCEAMWHGVPAIVRREAGPEGRLAAALLETLGLHGLIGTGDEGYVEAAVALATDRDRLGRLRAELRWRMADSALCDHGAFARGIAEALLNRAARIAGDMVGRRAG